MYVARPEQPTTPPELSRRCSAMAYRSPIRRTALPANVVAGGLALALLLSGCGHSVEHASSTAETPAASSAGQLSQPAAPNLSDGASSGQSGTVGTGNAKAAKTGNANQPATVNANQPAAGQTPQKTQAGAKPIAAQNGGKGAATTVNTGLAAQVARLVAAQPIFGGTAPCKPATSSEIPIGNVSTLSGVLGELFSPIRMGLETFVTSQNACGGLNGHRIKFYIDDDQGDPSTAVSRVLKMIQNNKVLAFVGNIEVLTVDAIVPTIKKYGIPIIGSDLTNNTWFTNALMFPQGSDVQSTAYGFIQATTEYFKKTKIGNVYCLEVPRACEQAARALKELAPKYGAQVVWSQETSITSVSYVQQCLDMQAKGVEVVAMNMDAASEIRMARSCTQVGFHPKITAYPIGVGNERQFLQGTSWLGDTYIPLNTFPWMAGDTPAEQYFQAQLKKLSPGQANGAAASLGWTSGALLVAASAGLSETAPTTQQLLDTLYTFKGQKFTELGGLSGPKSFSPDGRQKVPYCLFNAVSNDANTGWKSAQSKAECTTAVAPSDPQSQY
jgi:branched-chain amino acid transport system substrate-binding protein